MFLLVLEKSENGHWLLEAKRVNATHEQTLAMLALNTFKKDTFKKGSRHLQDIFKMAFQIGTKSMQNQGCVADAFWERLCYENIKKEATGFAFGKQNQDRVADAFTERSWCATCAKRGARTANLGSNSAPKSINNSIDN